VKSVSVDMDAREVSAVKIHARTIAELLVGCRKGRARVGKACANPRPQYAREHDEHDWHGEDEHPAGQRRNWHAASPERAQMEAGGPGDMGRRPGAEQLNVRPWPIADVIIDEAIALTA
jgi:hypothetical protein